MNQNKWCGSFCYQGHDLDFFEQCISFPWTWGGKDPISPMWCNPQLHHWASLLLTTSHWTTKNSNTHSICAILETFLGPFDSLAGISLHFTKRLQELSPHLWHLSSLDGLGSTIPLLSLLLMKGWAVGEILNYTGSTLFFGGGAAWTTTHLTLDKLSWPQRKFLSDCHLEMPASGITYHWNMHWTSQTQCLHDFRDIPPHFGLGMNICILPSSGSFFNKSWHSLLALDITYLREAWKREFLCQIQPQQWHAIKKVGLTSPWIPR